MDLRKANADEYMNEMEKFRQKLLQSRFQDLDHGCTRQVFVRNQTVIKIPRNLDGLIDNGVEWLAWRKYRNKPTPLGLVLAPCRLMRNGCLMMVRVDRLYTEDDIPWKTWDYKNGCWLTDGIQAGTYKDRVVAYDYAHDIPERVHWENRMGLVSKWQGGWYVTCLARWAEAVSPLDFEEAFK